MTKEQQEAVWELKREWLSEYGQSISDLHSDEGGDFIFVVNDMGDEGDGYRTENNKVYLPDFTEAEANEWLKNNPDESENLLGGLKTLLNELAEMRTLPIKEWSIWNKN